MEKKWCLALCRRFGCALILGALGTAPVIAMGQTTLSDMEELGKRIFFDENLSSSRTQSCASCHNPEMGFTSPRALVNLFGGSEIGAVTSRAGNRRPPPVGYATFSENFVVGRRGVSGGTFWDGRATGEIITADIFPARWSISKVAEMTLHLGPVPDQAMAPFLNDVEQNLKHAKQLCQRVKKSDYARLWNTVWGERIRCGTPELADLHHKRIAFSIAVWESSGEVNSFSSLRDAALAADADGVFPLDALSDEENLGHALFNLSPNAGGCGGFCHASGDGNGPNELYGAPSAGYFNIGVPRNPFNPWYLMSLQLDDNGDIINPDGFNWVDLGLGARSGFVGSEGKFKTPILRNADKKPTDGTPKAFAHNGYFKSLKAIVHFYNTRDMKPVCTNFRGRSQKFVTEEAAMYRGCWPEPEVLSDNIRDCGADDVAGDICKVPLVEGETFESYCDNPANPRDIGNLCLSDAEEDAIVAYLKTLTDAVTAQPPSN